MPHTDARARKVETLSAVVTRANGRVENRGVISYSGPNPLKCLGWRAWIGVKARYWIWYERRHQ